MTFDLTKYFAEGLEESQQGESGKNHDNNCVPDSVTLCLMALDYPDIAPQTITDEVYGPGHLGGESFDAMISWVHQHVDANLVMTVESGDTIALLERFGGQRFPMIFLGSCDAAGNYTAVRPVADHASCVLRRSANWTVLLNSERGQEVGYDDAALKSITTGWVMVFHRALPLPITPPPAPITENTDMVRTFPSQTQTPDGTMRSAWLTDATWVEKGYALGTVMVSRWDGQHYQWGPLQQADGTRGQLVEIFSYGTDTHGDVLQGINSIGELWQFAAGTWTKDS